MAPNWVYEAGTEGLSKEKLAARHRAEAALDEVRRAVEGNGVWAGEEGRISNGDVYSEKGGSHRYDSATPADRPMGDSPAAAAAAHHPCICACLSAVLGPQKRRSSYNTVQTEDATPPESDNEQSASEEETSEGDPVDMFEEKFEARQVIGKVGETFKSGSEPGGSATAAARRAAERARLERLCLELARLEARLQDVVARGRASRPRTARSESPPVPEFEDKGTIFERAVRRSLPEDSKPSKSERPRAPRSARAQEKPPEWAELEPSRLAQGAYSAAQLCRLGVKPCAHRPQRNSIGQGAPKMRGRAGAAAAALCCEGCGSARACDTWTPCAAASEAKGAAADDQLARLRRHHRALSAHCRRQVTALQEVAARARVAEGLATRATRAAAAATRPAAGTRCGPAAVCKNGEGYAPLWMC